MATKDLDSRHIRKQEELDDMITCCICTEVYTDPKGLLCLHTFCMKCVQETGLKTNNGPGDEMPCPICRRMFKIPPEGFNGLPKNLFIESLIQMTNVSGQSASSRALCDACLEEDVDAGSDIIVANMFCVDCNQKYCAECSRHHRKLKLTKDHNLIAINEHDRGLLTYEAHSVCELHEHRVLDVYCVDCKTVVCASCFVEDHKHHKGSHVDKFVNDFRKQIESSIQTIEDCRSKAQTKQREFLEVKEDIQERLVKLECDVTNRTDELKQMIDKHATSLLQDLCSIKQSKLKEIQMATDDIDMYLSCLETYSSYCQKIMAKGSASDICSAFSNVSSRAMGLQQECQPLTEREIQSINLCFRKSELEEFVQENCESLIGKIEENQQKGLKLHVKEKLKHELSDTDERMMVPAHGKQRLSAELRWVLDPVLVHTIIINSGKNTKRLGHAEEINWICGIAILGEELFVVSQNSSEFEVYDLMKFNICRRCNLEQSKYVIDIESCQKNQCLYMYIYDYKAFDQSSEILRVDPNGKLIAKWATGVDQCFIDAFGLSVTSEANVVLSDSYGRKLNEYSPDGQLIRGINIYSDAGYPNPYHAIKLTNGNFLVCCGSDGDDLYTVCKVDAGGKIKKSFGGNCGSSIGQINCRVYLSVDGNGFVMVADSENCRVLLLDSDLQFKKEILSRERHGLQCPEKILLDESNGRLFVADNDSNNHRILIFEFK